MELTSSHPFWSLKNGLVRTYPPLTEDVRCDVVVLGAGITGAMLAQALTKRGKSVVVVDRRDVCTGSTSASTALLQYEIDITLVELSRMIGREAAERAYRLSHNSIDDIRQLALSFGDACDFEPKTSIYLAHNRQCAKLLADETRARKSIGLDVTYHNASAVEDAFGIQGEAALSSVQAASCDPYRFAHALLDDAVRNGARVFDRTAVTEFECNDQGVRFKTDREAVISARHAVIASGYESQNLLRERVVNLANTYAIVSQPLPDIKPWHRNWMLWETKQPYLYLRITSDSRLLVGGEDDAFNSPVLRDARLESKAKVIEAKARALVPDLQWEREFAWAGTFGKTRDSLPYIGASPEYASCLFALGFGGNGITFSAIATKLIADTFCGNATADLELFRFGRRIGDPHV